MDERMIENLECGAMELAVAVVRDHPLNDKLAFASPIERALGVAVDIHCRLVWGHGVVCSTPNWTYQECVEYTKDRHESGARFRMFPQVHIGPYRVDFLVLHEGRGDHGLGGFVVECDGHEFHERTKEQAAKDRARDRELLALGHAVVRFTGSEIWRSPMQCAATVWTFMRNRAFEAST